MIYFFQKRFGDDIIRILQVSAGWYVLLAGIVWFIVTIIYDERPGYGEFFQVWTKACSGMVVLFIAVLEFGITLVVIIGREKTVLHSLPMMIPQCVMLVCVIIVNMVVIGNPGEFRRLSVDMIRVQQGNPEEEEVTRFYVESVIHSMSDHETKYDYYLEFGDKRAQISGGMYAELYAMIGGKGDVGYRRGSPPGRWRIRYLPNSMTVIDVAEIKEKTKFPQHTDVFLE